MCAVRLPPPRCRPLGVAVWGWGRDVGWGVSVPGSDLHAQPRYRSAQPKPSPCETALRLLLLSPLARSSVCECIRHLRHSQKGTFSVWGATQETLSDFKNVLEKIIIILVLGVYSNDFYFFTL